MRFNTSLLHGNFSGDERTGATGAPIYQSTSFQHKTAEELESIFKGNAPGYVYTRINNPTIDSFERRLAFLEGGVGAVACASGMAAVALAIMNIVKQGEEIVAGSGIFGGTCSLFHDLEAYGIKARYVQDNDIETFDKAINEKTRLLFVETIGNPKLDVPDLRALAELAHSKGIPLVVDNTVTTPYLVKPIKLGADLVVHSTSKYINGSGNSIGGVIIDSGKFKWDFDKFTSLKEFKKFGAFVYLAKLRNSLFRNLGPCISPFNAYLNSIGLETLGLRMEKLCENAIQLALSLKRNGKVLSVNYPGLRDNNYYRIAKEQFNDRYGAILTIRVGSKENAFKVINHLQYASNLANIGDSRTLVIHTTKGVIVVTNNRELLSLLAEMTKASRCCQQDAILGGGITFTQFYILDLIGKNGTLQLSDLHDLLSVEKSTSTRLVEPLVQQGLVKKQRSEFDCRAINLVLTDSGRKIKEELWERLNSFLEKLSSQIPEDKHKEVYNSVRLFLTAIKNLLNDHKCC
ncbi:MAG: aminotransferase class I/II-fold pyridoxal phosphate-dependent enzyme [Peptococcaceae bacterium]|nr:aminotransferase class I/II-fold pyridoxal phosphate-dependent enzyme [Peptococcaceae bacterium]